MLLMWRMKGPTCRPLRLRHAFSKVCQYATTHDKMLVGLTCASIKDIQGVIWKCITWPKTFGKGMQICMHRIKFSLSLDWGLETKHTCENKGNKKFWLLFLLFCGFRTYMHAFVVHKCWLLCLCCWLQNCKSSIVVSRCMFWYFQTTLYCATNNLWHYKIMYHLQEPRLYVKSWWKFCPQLSLVLFWTKVMYIGCLWMYCDLSYQLVETFGKS